MSLTPKHVLSSKVSSTLSCLRATSMARLVGTLVNRDYIILSLFTTNDLTESTNSLEFRTADWEHPTHGERTCKRYLDRW